jgi:hypothetical protein
LETGWAEFKTQLQQFHAEAKVLAHHADRRRQPAESVVGLLPAREQAARCLTERAITEECWRGCAIH